MSTKNRKGKEAVVTEELRGGKVSRPLKTSTSEPLVETYENFFGCPAGIAPSGARPQSEEMFVDRRCPQDDVASNQAELFWTTSEKLLISLLHINDLGASWNSYRPQQR
jgi:hypothetical protein